MSKYRVGKIIVKNLAGDCLGVVEREKIDDDWRWKSYNLHDLNKPSVYEEGEDGSLREALNDLMTTINEQATEEQKS